MSEEQFVADAVHRLPPLLRQRMALLVLGGLRFVPVGSEFLSTTPLYIWRLEMADNSMGLLSVDRDLAALVERAWARHHERLGL